jgi:hypothetical protein
MTRALVFPGGAGGNHLRWLMYLDSSIDTEKTIEQKIDFILNEVYSIKRSFYNWLPWESQWRYDDKYESFIRILHEPKDDKPKNKTIFLSFDDYKIPLEHYSVLTSCFTSETSYNHYYKFLKDFDRKVNTFIEISTENKLILKTDIFFDSELDKNFYKSVIDWYELENHYEECCILHNKWYEVRKRVEREAYEFYTGTFWKSYLARIEPVREDVHRNKVLLP